MEDDDQSPRSEVEVAAHQSNKYLRVGPDEYEKFAAISSEKDRWEFMTSFSTIDYHSDNARSDILQEYLFHMLHFCVDNELNFEQMSAIIVLSENIFFKCALDPNIQTEEAKLIFREQIAESILSQGNEDSSISIDVLKKLAVFCMQNFIRHLSLYQFVFSQRQHEVHDSKYIVVQTPMLLPSLMEATNYNGQDIGVETARTDYTEEETGRSEYEQGETGRTDYTEYTEDEY